MQTLILASLALYGVTGANFAYWVHKRNLKFTPAGTVISLVLSGPLIWFTVLSMSPIFITGHLSARRRFNKLKAEYESLVEIFERPGFEPTSADIEHAVKLLAEVRKINSSY